MNRSVGLCVGASSITLALRTSTGFRFESRLHDGDVGSALSSLVNTLKPERLGVTGRKYRKLLAFPTLSEPEAVERAFASVRSRYPATDSIVSAGGETFLVYSLDSGGKIKTVHSGNKCAAGTGEFFLQQIRRMGLGVEEALSLADGAAPYGVAGRCSVFCKSDCTHALNKGVPKSQVVAGLCRMMAGKIADLLKKAKGERIALIGNVSRNRVLVKLLQESFPRIYVPEEAPGFEALGALLWAETTEARIEVPERLLVAEPRSFELLPPLSQGLDRVTFCTMPAGQYHSGDYVLGLDVGSTTTKAVLVRSDNREIVARSYLRTQGDPIGASRACYRHLLGLLPPGLIPHIVGLGVTGSGRQIAGLHAFSGGIINEIVAHAAAAVHFDPEVETIFEIGGQDAKYTSLTHRVASDYAMNEACSAGTGSFLEEACSEAFGIATEEIADLALAADRPPNFSDQCAAFIGSDIKTAAQEGVARNDMAAGLVYSVCQNYLNRVKGNRPVGKKIFMQGGVCYNRAVPAAMAVLCGQPIVVPPEPGLMGAFGAALETLRKIETGLLPHQAFDLGRLANREVAYREPFTCQGGRDRCDRKCTIARVVLENRSYPFGGACNRYYNLRQFGHSDHAGSDLVSLREELVLDRYFPETRPDDGVARTIGLLPSLFGATFLPFYAHFFTNLGLRSLTVSTPDPDGLEATGAAFCYPATLSHGFLRQLLHRKIDHVFLPHVKNAALEPGFGETNCTCPLVQGEPYYLKAAFHDDLAPKLLTAVLNFEDQADLRKTFVAIGRQLGFSRRQGNAAFDLAWQSFLALRRDMLEQGRNFLASLRPDEMAVVLFGRPYNAFSSLTNMGIPHKFASRGYRVIPHDFLLAAASGEKAPDHMYWTSGRQILQVGQFVARHPNLFGVFVSSFSCGPDSFLLGYFRNLMGQKPTLVLELDAHTADAGIDTRIEAFLDIARSFREMARAPAGDTPFIPLHLEVGGGQALVEINDGRRVPLTDPAVRVLLPSMGESTTMGFAAAFRYAGIAALAAPPPGREELALGKGIATCKECLPLLLTAGTLRKYLREEHRPEEILLYFMPGSDGPCRLGQYQVMLRDFLIKNRVENVGLLTLTCENGYAGLSNSFTRRAWQAICIGDGLEDVRAGILALAVDPKAALAAFDQARDRIIRSLETDSRTRLLAVLEEEMTILAGYQRKGDLRDAVRVNLVGEIYARRDGFSRQGLVEKLADRGIVVKTAPIAEWLHFSDYCVLQGLAAGGGVMNRLAVRLKQSVKHRDEVAIQQRLALSEFFEAEFMDMDRIIGSSRPLVNPQLATEASLTIGSTLLAWGEAVHGVISIGPFGCMPCRIAEAVLNCRLPGETASRPLPSDSHLSSGTELTLPFLAIETDGNPFPQLVEARLDSFILAAQRLREELARRDRVQAGWSQVSGRMRLKLFPGKCPSRS